MPEGNKPQFDFKSNHLNFLNHKPTTLIPCTFVGNKVLGFGAVNGPAIEKAISSETAWMDSGSAGNILQQAAALRSLQMMYLYWMISVTGGKK